MLALLPPLYLSWGIGANDTANAFGPQIGSDIIAFRQGTVLAAVFAFLGAVNVVMLVGRGITALDPVSALVATLSAALTVHLFTPGGPMSRGGATC